MAHLRRGRMNFSDAVAVNPAKAKSSTIGFPVKKAALKPTLKNGKWLHCEISVTRSLLKYSLAWNQFT